MAKFKLIEISKINRHVYAGFPVYSFTWQHKINDNNNLKKIHVFSKTWCLQKRITTVPIK